MTDGPFDKHDPYKTTSIERLLREATSEDMQKESDIENLFKDKLEALTVDIWERAEDNARDAGRKTIQEEDLVAAFDDLFYPYTLIEEMAVTVGEYEQELRSVAADLEETSIEDSRDD